MIPKASEDLFGYKNWLKSLKAMPVGTILCWNNGYTACTASSAIKPRQFTKVARIRKSNGISDLPEHDQVYELVICAKNGKEFKKKLFWRVSGVAQKIHDGEITIVNNG